jgi:hypothetical protein
MLERHLRAAYLTGQPGGHSFLPVARPVGGRVALNLKFIAHGRSPLCFPAG